MKKLFTTLAIIFFFFLTFVALKNIIVSRLLEKAAEGILGLNITIKDLDVSPLGTHLRMEGLTIYNPGGFEEKEMAYIPLVSIVCDPLEYIKNKKVHFYLLDLNVERINIVKNSEGLVNIKEIKVIQHSGQQQKGEKKSFSIEILRLGLGDIYYTDHRSGGATKTRKFSVHIKDAMFSNIDSPQDIIDLVILKILANTEIGKLINMSIVPIVSDVSDVVVLTGKTVEATIKGFLDGITMPLKILFKTQRINNRPY